MLKRWNMKWQFLLMAWILDIGLLASSQDVDQVHSSDPSGPQNTFIKVSWLLKFDMTLYIQFAFGNIVSCCTTTKNYTCDMKPYILSIDFLESIIWISACQVRSIEQIIVPWFWLSQCNQMPQFLKWCKDRPGVIWCYAIINGCEKSIILSG